MIIFALLVIRRRRSLATQLRYESGAVVRPPAIIPGEFHLFLSHNWEYAQDQMRIIKERLQLMLPSARTFLDVDDLATGKGAEYVDVSQVTLVFCSQGYFGSANCMRELLRAVLTSKPIITLLEPEVRRGGLTTDQILEQLREADSQYESWGLAQEVRGWAAAEGLGAMPSADELYAALFAAEAIEWNRVGAFQKVTMRLIAERLLPAAASGTTYIPGELHRLRVALPPPQDGRGYHLFCSEHNAGALELAQEMADALSVPLRVSSEASSMHECARVLVYLNGLTWTSGARSVAFAAQLEQAMQAGLRPLLVHETPGALGAGELRHACEFGSFFSTTPQALLDAKLYDPIAIALKQAQPWRHVSLVMMAQELAGHGAAGGEGDGLFGCATSVSATWARFGQSTKAGARFLWRSLAAVHSAGHRFRTTRTATDIQLVDGEFSPGIAAARRQGLNSTSQMPLSSGTSFLG